MTAVAIIIFLISLGVLGWTLVQRKKIREEREINLLISQSLRSLYDTAQIEVERNKKLVESAAQIAEDARNTLGLADPDNMMDDPGMLATLVTAIVYKLGDLKLSVSDFAVLREDTFVSIYVDTLSQDLILSLKDDLVSDDPIPLATFTRSDDETYH
jgi:hypothetical protein|tara:strand:- start:6128 stop:6598 length:471 start_codon:yes stop_codon:yes gene_type:complete